MPWWLQAICVAGPAPLQWRQPIRKADPIVQAALAEARQLLNSGKPREALGLLRPLAEANVAPLQVHSLSAMAAMELGDRAGVLAHLEACVGALGRAAQPAQTRLRLADRFAEAGAIDRAEAMVQEAIGFNPQDLEILVKGADVLGNHGCWRQALDYYRSALERLPEHASILASAGIAAHNVGDRQAAEAYYLRALASDSSQVNVYSNLLAVLIDTQRTNEAYDHCRLWLDTVPDDIEAMSFMALLAVETGRREVAEPWLDYDRLVRTHTVQPPPGQAGLAAFNRALEKAVLGQPDLKMPPEDHPTWHHPALRIGPHINVNSSGPIKQLEALMYEGVERYFAETGADDDHPFLKQRPRDYHILAWSAVLDGEGNQQPHIHMSGYLSGCYYVTIPDEISSPDNGADGRIKGGFEVGRPPRELPFSQPFPLRTIKPHEGLMVLFPAYLYHGTVPFKSRQRRISIAFDLIPGKPDAWLDQAT